MSETAIRTLGSAGLFVLLTWIAATLLAFRDRYWPPADRIETVGPHYPPKWARGRRTARIIQITLLPLGLFALTVALIALTPLYVWWAIMAAASRARLHLSR